MQSVLLSVLSLSLLMATPSVNPRTVGAERPNVVGADHALFEKRTDAAYSGLLNPMRSGILGNRSSALHGGIASLFAQKGQRTKPKNLLCTSYPCPAGYFWYYFNDPLCPNHPDTYEAYIEYWNEDASFAYDSYAGHATYYCGGYQPSTVGSASNYQDCVANSPWNCNDLGYTNSPHP